jgi:hypothetical protein
MTAWKFAGIILGVFCIIYAIMRSGHGDEMTQCLGCNALFLPSNSDADDKYLFHSIACESDWENRNGGQANDQS